MSVQDLKDSFYVALRGLIAAGNPARTIVLRGVVRPGVVVVENELPYAGVDGISMVEAFCLRWTALACDMQGLLQATCEIRYATDGTAGAAALDRGRALAALDAELIAALNAAPQTAELARESEVAGGGASNAADQGARVFWGDVAFGAVTMRAERMERTATVEVFAYDS